MSAPKLYGVRLFRKDSGPELILDFDNDRHHMVKIKKGADARDLAAAFYDFAAGLAADPKLWEE